MKLLNTYEDREQAEAALQKITGEKRLASERDSTTTVYNLFGIPTWTNFYKLDMFNLPELKIILDERKEGNSIDFVRYKEIMNMLRYVASSFDIKIPDHWL
ncbi:hypothetical protein GSO30_002213 [Salmonella enterica]|nr:hypothetical protein [Salmonella enterica]EGB7057961.1 hypothetical protein [Salmonella enterica]EKL9528263.1 hypothetical protein [Salmonella enterica]